MEVLNISRLGNQIKGLNVIGINDKGHLILKGSGEHIDCFGSAFFSNGILLYEYNPANDELTGVFNDSIIFDLYITNNSHESGEEYFFEIENEARINVIKWDLNRGDYERLFSLCSVDDINKAKTNIQLIYLTDNYVAVKIYSKKTCEIFIYDKQMQRKYYIHFPENDDMRYAKIYCIENDDNPIIVFVKNGKSDLKMEFYIHQWEWTEDFKQYKDEKIFLFPIKELTDKGNIFLDEHYMIAQAGETHYLNYHGFFHNCFVYSRDYFMKYDELEGEYKNQMFFHDKDINKITRSITFQGNIVISNSGKMYESIRFDDQLIIKDKDDDIEYILPYRNARLECIIDNQLILKIKSEIIIYDLTKRKETGKYYTDDKKLYVLPPVRDLAIDLNYRYFEKEDILVLY